MTDNAMLVLEDLACRGVSVWRDGDELLFEADRPADNDGLWDWLRAHHVEILAAVKASEASAATTQAIAAVPACSPHNNPARYVDAPAAGGMIRTTCEACGRFVGYRPRPRHRKGKKT